MRVAIFDLKFMHYIYHSTPTPTMETLLISGYEKEIGNTPVFCSEPPNFTIYEKVYIVKESWDLFHDPDWLKRGNIILVGKGWGPGSTWETEWENSMPDMSIYKKWIEDWTKRYPKFSKNRLTPFFRKPFKLKCDGRVSLPKQDGVLIIDNDIEEWDSNYEILKAIESRDFMLLYPLVLDGRWEDALQMFAQRYIRRANFWAKMDLQKYNREDIEEAIETYNKYKPGRMFRIKAFDEAWTDDQWVERLRFDYWAFGEFRMKAGRRLSFQPFGHEGLMIERVIKEYKRWCAKDNGYKRNSLFDYMLYDGCRNTEQMAMALNDPYLYIEKKLHGKNKFIQLIPIIENYPEVMDIITTSYPKGAI